MNLDRHHSSKHEISRQQFLKRAGMTAAGFAAVAGTYGCGSSSTSATSGQSGAPRRGGTLHAALTGGTSSDTLDGQNGLNTVDAARTIALYDFLVFLDLNAQPQLGLAQEISPNHDATQWMIRLRPDIAFHNGKPLTADDVIYSLRRIIKNHYPAASTWRPWDAHNLTARERKTVRRLCGEAAQSFAEALPRDSSYSLAIVPVGYDPRQPVGTGPFSYVSFTPGQESVFQRNNNYWQNGKPYVDKLVISDFSDETSQVNALIGGQADLANNLSASSIGQVNSKRDRAHSERRRHDALHYARRCVTLHRRTSPPGHALALRSPADASTASLKGTGPSRTTFSRLTIRPTTGRSHNGPTTLSKLGHS